ncbi:hypothetical protein [Delftia acidovorans]|jgi:hypothetical protein|uniref:hypothetical protein n=1 Tax=Delftia acidovorans TaxID=80866 RepID=UPI00286F0DDA|nr:hypothetical protein [Delftia acidovorans]
MNAINNSKPSLAPSKYLAIVLILVFGAAISFLYWPDSYTGENLTDWKAFASTMAGISATMVGFLCAVGALLYTVSNTSLVVYLRDQGIEKRILIDLFFATIVWLLSLFFSIFANFPVSNINPITSAMLSFGFTISGLISFFPIGYSLWMVLTNLNANAHVPTKKSISEREWTDDIDLS